MNDRAITSLLRRAALLATTITRLRTIGLPLLGLPRIAIAHRRPVPLRTRERSHANPPAQLPIHWPVLYPALRMALVSPGAVRPI